jgi:F0F1-type ATP synthase membrane subunit b/b'
METYLAVKTFLKKVWTWTKHYWYVPAVIIYTLVLWFVFKNKDRALDILKIREESLKDQMDVINEAHKKEIERRNKVLEEYNKILEDLEEEYKEGRKELSEQKKKEIKSIIEKYYENPESIAKELAEKFGFVYMTEAEKEKERRLRLG